MLRLYTGILSAPNPHGLARDRTRASAVRERNIKTSGGHEVAVSRLKMLVSPKQSTDFFCAVRTLLDIHYVCDLLEIKQTCNGRKLYAESTRC